MILALQTNTFGTHGGIPTYNRIVCQVLNEYDAPLPRHLLIANDSAGDLRHACAFSKLKLSSFACNRVAFVAKVLRLGLTKRINLALIGHVNYAPLGLLLKRLQPSLRYGVMVHGVEVWLRLSWLKRLALQRADFITSVSEYTKQRIVEMNGVQSERVYILPNTIEWDQKQPLANGRLHQEGAPNAQRTIRTPPNGLGKTLKLLSVCRLEASERYKGVDHVIEALPEVLLQVPDLEYFIIGSGSDLNRLKDLAVDRGVASRVHFLGSVPYEALQATYLNCDVFVLPSAGEGFGIVYLEAMQHAKPVLAAASAAVPEVVSHDTTGLLVDYGDHNQIATALIRLCKDGELRKALGVAGYERLQKNFTFEHFRTRFTKILDREMPPLALDSHRVELAGK